MNAALSAAQAQACLDAAGGPGTRALVTDFPGARSARVGVPSSRVGDTGGAVFGVFGPIRLPESSTDTSWPSECELLARLNQFVA